MRLLVLLCAAATTTALVGCAATPRFPPPRLMLPEGPCNAPEYVAKAKSGHDGELTMNVTLSDIDRARAVEETVAIGNLSDDQVDEALYIVRRAFHCRQRPPEGAARIVTGYKFRYVAKMLSAGVDAERCGHAASYPASALRFGAQQSVPLGVTLDEHGTVEDAWPIKPVDPYGFTRSAIDALLHSCHFTPALIDGRPVPFFLVYRFEFEIQRSQESPLL